MIPDVGQKIRLVKMANDPCPIEPGTTGTVRKVVPQSLPRGDVNDCTTFWTQVWVDWDAPRSLMLIIPPDEVEIIE